jgi:hypothetical protein
MGGQVARLAALQSLRRLGEALLTVAPERETKKGRPVKDDPA